MIQNIQLTHDLRKFRKYRAGDVRLESKFSKP